MQAMPSICTIRTVAQPGWCQERPHGRGHLLAEHAQNTHACLCPGLLVCVWGLPAASHTATPRAALQLSLF